MDHTLRVHQDVNAEIFTAAFGHDAVALNTQRVKEHFKRLALVVESIEHDTDVIVLKDIVALGHRSPDLVRFISSFEGDVEELCVESDQYFGRLRRRRIVTRLDLIEVFKNGRRL